MSGTSVSLRFGVVINDSDKWTPWHVAKAEAENSPGDYDSWVADQLSEVMRTAALAFMRANPDLFRIQEIF